MDKEEIKKYIEEEVERRVNKRIREKEYNSSKDSSKEKDESMSRRSFLKKFGLGIGAATLLPTASALNIKSNDFSFYGDDGALDFQMDTTGNIVDTGNITVENDSIVFSKSKDEYFGTPNAGFPNTKVKDGYAIQSIIKFGGEGSKTNSTSYVTIKNSDITLDWHLLKNPNQEVYVKILYHLGNETFGTHEDRKADLSDEVDLNGGPDMSYSKWAQKYAISSGKNVYIIDEGEGGKPEGLHEKYSFSYDIGGIAPKSNGWIIYDETNYELKFYDMEMNLEKTESSTDLDPNQSGGIESIPYQIEYRQDSEEIYIKDYNASQSQTEIKKFNQSGLYKENVFSGGGRPESPTYVDRPTNDSEFNSTSRFVMTQDGAIEEYNSTFDFKRSRLLSEENPDSIYNVPNREPGYDYGTYKDQGLSVGRELVAYNYFEDAFWVFDKLTLEGYEINASDPGTKARIVRQYSGAHVEGTEVSVKNNGYQYAETDWIDFSRELWVDNSNFAPAYYGYTDGIDEPIYDTSAESYHIQLKSTQSTVASYNSVIMLIATPKP